MAELWLPGDSDFALAMREPNLLVPGRKPVGSIDLDPRVLRLHLFRSPNFLRGEKSPTLINDATYPFSYVHGYQNYPGIVATTGCAHTERIANLPSAFTVFARVFIPITGSAFIFSQAIGTSYDYSLYRHESSGTWYTYWGSNQSAGGSIAATYNAWVDVALVVNGSYAYVYDNGTFNQLTSSYSKADSGSAVYAIGKRDVTSFRQNALSFEMAGVLRGALTKAQLDALFACRYRELVRPANDSPLMVSVPAVGGVPTLSLPGVTGVQATQATPKVTLTF